MKPPSSAAHDWSLVSLLFCVRCRNGDRLLPRGVVGRQLRFLHRAQAVLEADDVGDAAVARAAVAHAAVELVALLDAFAFIEQMIGEVLARLLDGRLVGGAPAGGERLHRDRGDVVRNHPCRRCRRPASQATCR